MQKDDKKRKRNSSRKKRDIKKIVIRAVAAVLILYFIYFTVWQQVMINRKNKELEGLTVKIEEATRESERLQKEIENLSDPEYIEQYARENLGLVRPNERVFVDSNKSSDNIGE